MRRAAFAIISTIAGIVGLLSFKTHPTTLASSPGVTVTGPVGTAGGSSGSGSGTSGTTRKRAASATKRGSRSSTAQGSTAQNSKTQNSKTQGSKAHGSTRNSSTKNSTTPSTKTVTGAAVDTPYGPIQVRIRVTNGEIANAAVVQYPSQDSHSQQISYYAIPMLEKESVGRSSANIDMVSGATYTSEGYLQSLQSALNKAGL